MVKRLHVAACSVAILILACAHAGDVDVVADEDATQTDRATASRATQDIAEIVSCGACAPELRRSYAESVHHAQQIVEAFAQQQGFRARGGFDYFDRVVVFDGQDQLWQAVLRVHTLPADTVMPTTSLAAALEGRILMAVRPDLYAELVPDYGQFEAAWTRLLAHEIAHQLHVDILRGDEDAMGPPWFYEGFASVAAGQQLGAPLEYESADQALAGVREDGPSSYRRFAAALRYFQRCRPLSVLVEMAGADEFEDALRSNC